MFPTAVNGTAQRRYPRKQLRIKHGYELAFGQFLASQRSNVING